MRHLIFLTAMALASVGAVASNATDAPDSASTQARGPVHLDAQQMDGISAGQRNIHVHPNSAVSVPSDGLSMPEASGNAVDNTDSSVLADHP